MDTSPLPRYSETASRSAGVVISRYSTSFGLACRLLGPAARRDVENIYALVRVADEAVDGAAAAAGLEPDAVAAQLERLEQEVESALSVGYSTNMVVHAFAVTARRHGITSDLTRPFFESMRADLTVARHDDASLHSYIYVSEEEVVLMCLRDFRSMPGAVEGHDDELEAAARSLGSAFQKVNFLRDLATDQDQLGRRYLVSPSTPVFDDATKDAVVEQIRAELATAETGFALLAPGARRAVSLAHGLFSSLVDRLDAVPASHLLRRRVRVSGAGKAAVLLRVVAHRPARQSGAA